MVNVWINIFSGRLPSVSHPILQKKVRLSLIFGIIAAALWGLHDLLVRLVSQRLGVLNSLIWVIFFGTIFLFFFSLIQFNSLAIYPENLSQSFFFRREIILSGVFFSIAMLALFKSLKIGPLAIVAPIIGIYPIISLILAYLAGAEIRLIFWPLVFFVVLGIAIISIATPEESSQNELDSHKKYWPMQYHFTAIIYSLLAAVSFAITFHFGQQASNLSNTLEVSLHSRVVTFTVIFLVFIFTQTIIIPRAREIFFLGLMGLLDVAAISLVFGAGKLEIPALAPVAASNFGIFTLVLAYFILGEKLNTLQVAGIISVFSCLTVILLV